MFKSQTSEDTAVLILSCDKYADIWPPFFSFFQKYWPRCPFKIYLGSNEKRCSVPGVHSILSGKAADWSNDTLRILDQIPEKYVIIVLEDYFINKPVDQLQLDQCIIAIRKTDAAYIRLASFPVKYHRYFTYVQHPEFPFLGITSKDADYMVSLQAGIWNKKELQNLIQPGESPWDFEVNGSERARRSGKTYLGILQDPTENYVHGPIPYLCTAVTKGAWMYDAVKLMEKEKIGFDLGSRPEESRMKFFRRSVYSGSPIFLQKIFDYLSSHR